jgi:hypothetical protein
VLSGARFGDNSFLPHSLGQETLSQGVIYFMGPGMREVFPFQEKVNIPQIPGKPLGPEKGCRPAYVIPAERIKLRPKPGIGFDFCIGLD